MIGRKTVLAAMAAMAVLAGLAPAATAAPAAPNGTITLVRADKSTVTVPWQTGPNGVLFAVDPRNKDTSSGLENAVVLGSTSVQDDCPHADMCIYENSNWSGYWLGLPVGTGFDNLSVVRCDGCQSSTHHPASNGTYNDQMSSWRNFSGHAYCWTFNADRQGEFHSIVNGAQVNVTDHENDEATSVVPFDC